VPLHSLSSSGEIIKNYAIAGKINIISTEEPGTRIKVKVLVPDASGDLQINALVYVYNTSK